MLAAKAVLRRSKKIKTVKKHGHKLAPNFTENCFWHLANALLEGVLTTMKKEIKGRSKDMVLTLETGIHKKKSCLPLHSFMMACFHFIDIFAEWKKTSVAVGTSVCL